MKRAAIAQIDCNARKTWFFDRLIPYIFSGILLLIPLSCPGQEAPTDTRSMQASAQESGMDPHWPPLIARLTEDGMDRERMAQIFSDLPFPWSPIFMAVKIQGLYASSLRIGASVKPLPDKNLPQDPDYMPPTISGFEGAQALLKDYAPLLAAAQKRYGVPPPLIAAVLLLESDMGHEIGEALALHALASMAVTDTPEQALQGIEGSERLKPALRKKMEKSIREESALAYKELCALIRYCETGGIDILHVPGSVSGAIGLCQFMPGNISAYGVDSNNKGVIDLFSLPDAAYSIGNFLKEHGFAEKLSIKKQLEALRRYNQTDGYAALALGMSYQLAGKPIPAELGTFIARGSRKAWWPKIPPAYRLPSLGDYTINGSYSNSR